jgi:hypothetical protein
MFRFRAGWCPWPTGSKRIKDRRRIATRYGRRAYLLLKHLYAASFIFYLR